MHGDCPFHLLRVHQNFLMVWCHLRQEIYCHPSCFVHFHVYTVIYIYIYEKDIQSVVYMYYLFSNYNFWVLRYHLCIYTFSSFTIYICSRIRVETYFLLQYYVHIYVYIHNIVVIKIFALHDAYLTEILCVPLSILNPHKPVSMTINWVGMFIVFTTSCQMSLPCCLQMTSCKTPL